MSAKIKKIYFKHGFCGAEGGECEDGRLYLSFNKKVKFYEKNDFEHFAVDCNKIYEIVTSNSESVVTSLETEIDTLKAVIDTQKNKNDTLKNEINTLKAENQRLAEENNCLVEQVNSCKKTSKDTSKAPSKDTSKAPSKAPSKDNDGTTSKSQFEDFWSIYPKKRRKKDALKSWQKINPSKELFDSIISWIDTALKTGEWSNVDDTFIPDPPTWLNQERWNDEHSKRHSSASSVPVPADEQPQHSYDLDKIIEHSKKNLSKFKDKL